MQRFSVQRTLGVAWEAALRRDNAPHADAPSVSVEPCC